ncbi:MAG: hypothetical protein ACYCSW_06880 [bacterium]
MMLRIFFPNDSKVYYRFFRTGRSFFALAMSVCLASAISFADCLSAVLVVP